MTHPAEPLPGEDALYTISDDPGLLDLEVIRRYLAEESDRARGSARETVERSVRHSLCFGVYHHGTPGRVAQAAFARVVSDHATFVYLADVFILPDHRGRGLSNGLYRQFGFEVVSKPENRMERQ